MRLVCCLVLVLGGLQLACALRVAAWNIQTFGQSKANLDNPNQRKAAILEYIAMVIRHYDIIVIQEVKDTSANCVVCAEVLRVVNLNQPVVYASDSMGGNHERYLYLYRTATVQVTGTHQFINPVANPPTFDRPPYVARFQNLVAGQQRSFDFVMIPLHAKPGAGKTLQEINSLVDVVRAVHAQWNTQEMLLLGDFNAGGRYLRKKDKPTIALIPPNYYPLIPDSAATSMGKKPQPYDRIVATAAMMQYVVPNSAQVIDFQQQWGLPVSVQPTEITDHLIVELELQ